MWEKLKPTLPSVLEKQSKSEQGDIDKRLYDYLKVLWTRKRIVISLLMAAKREEGGSFGSLCKYMTAGHQMVVCLTSVLRIKEQFHRVICKK